MASRALGTLTWDLIARTAGFTAGLDEAERKAQSSTSKITSTLDGMGLSMRGIAASIAGYFSIDMFAGAMKSALDFADATEEVASSMGLAANEYLNLQAAVSLFTDENTNLMPAMVQLNKLIAENSDKLTGLGISTRDAAGNTRGAYDVMRDLADLFQEMPDGAEKTALAAELFGARVGAKLVPVLNEGSEALDDLNERVAHLSPELKQAQQDWEQSMFGMSQASIGLRNAIAEEIIPQINDLFEWMLASGDTFKPFLIVIGLVAEALKGLLVGALKSVLTAVSIVGLAFQELGKLIGTVIAAVVKASQGDFSGAWEAIKSGGSDMVKSFSQFGDQLIALWGEDEKAAQEHAKRMGEIVVPMSEPTVSYDLGTTGADGKKTSAPGANDLASGLSIENFDDVLAEKQSQLAEMSAMQQHAEAFERDRKFAALSEEILAEMEMREEAEDWFTEIKRKGAEERARFESMSAAQQTKSVLGAMEQMTAASASSSKKMFQLNKTAKLAQALIALPTSVMETMAAYPFPLSVAMGALAFSAGMQQIRSIQSASFGGAKASAPSAGASSRVVGAASASISTADQQQAPARQQRIDINLIGNGRRYTPEEVAAMMEEIGERLADGGGRIGKVTVMTA